MNYDDYLQSDDWQTFTKTLRKAGAECLGCEKGKPIQFHHLSYSHLGSETANDVIPVCKTCHDKIHIALGAELPRAPVRTVAKLTWRVWPRLFGTTLSEARTNLGWNDLFSTVFPNRKHQAIQCRGKITKKERRRARKINAMEQNRRYHERMCRK